MHTVRALAAGRALERPGGVLFPLRWLHTMHFSTDSHQARLPDRPVPKLAHGPAQQLCCGPPRHPCTQATSPVPHLAAEAAGAADAMDVQLTAVGQVIVDHQGHLRAGGLRGVAGWCVSGLLLSVMMRGGTGVCTHSTPCLLHGAQARAPSCAGTCTHAASATCLLHTHSTSTTCLLHIQAAGPHIGGDEHAGGSLAELIHDCLTLLLLASKIRMGDGLSRLSCNTAPCACTTRSCMGYSRSATKA